MSSHISKISVFLVSVGFGMEKAIHEAERLSKDLSSKQVAPIQVNGKTVTKTFNGKNLYHAPRGRKPSSPKGSVRAQIQAFAEKKKGNVWSLSELILNVDCPYHYKKHYISGQVSLLVKKGFIVRTGRAEYMLAGK
jgi:hypothetical protein